MAWGEERREAPAHALTGGALQLQLAIDALAAVGVEGITLAVAAIKAAGVIDALRAELAEVVDRHIRQEDTASGRRPQEISETSRTSMPTTSSMASGAR